MCRTANISRGIITDLKMGRTKKLSTDTLEKLSNYFSIPIDYLLTGEEAEQKNKPSAQGEGLSEERIKLNKKLTALSQENVNVVLEHVEFLLHKQKQENKQKQ